MRALIAMWRNLWRKPQVEADLDAELRAYAQLLEDEKTAAGVPPQAARRSARLELGGVESIKEEVRDVRHGATLEGLWTELRQSVRGLRRNPGMTILGIVMLALGMGASITIFSVFQAALLKPLPFREAERVVELVEMRPDRGVAVIAFSAANFWDMQAQNRSFSSVAAYHSDDANLTGEGTAEKVSTAAVTVDFLRTLGVAPVLGRDFTAADERATVALLGYKFWKTRYNGDAAVLGKTLRLNGKGFTVVGVLPPGEPWIDDQLYLPFAHDANADRSSWEFYVVGRLAPGVSAEAARADLQRVAGDLAQAYPKDDKGMGMNVLPSSRWIAPVETRKALWVLLGSVTLLLLIACMNVANLLLARGVARQREIAVRTALGAGRARLVRYVLMESLLLSGFGAAAGLALAFWTLEFLRRLELRNIPRLDDASLNPWVLGFAALVALLTGVLCGLAPALQAPASGIASVLRESDRQAGSRRQGRLRAMLVTSEVALSFLLLVGAGLLMRSFRELMTGQRGFQAEHRLMFSLNFPGSYSEKGVGKQFLDRFYEELSAMPEVISAGSVNSRPMQGGDPGMQIDSNARTHGTGPAPWSGWRIVSPGYFQTVGLPLLRGRVFDGNDKPVWAEDGQPRPVRRVVISERLAKSLFPNEDPIGKPVYLWKRQSDRTAEVVGVVGDSLERGLTSGPTLTVYLPYGRNALTSEFVLHTRGEPLAVVPAVRALVNRLDPNLPLADVRTFEDVINRSVSPQRLNSVLLTVFSGLALLLASLGIYGVLAYTISRRTAEIGLRMALGASEANILQATVVQGLRPVLVGILLGAAGAYGLSRSISSMLYGVHPFDAATYGGVAVLLLATAALACYLPGRRAMRIDPTTALRME